MSSTEYIITSQLGKNKMKKVPANVVTLIVISIVLVAVVLPLYVNILTVQKTEETIGIKYYGHPYEPCDTINLWLMASNYLPSQAHKTSLSLYEHIQFPHSKQRAVYLENVQKNDGEQFGYDTLFWLYYDKDGNARTYTGLEREEVNEIFYNHSPISITRERMQKMPAIVEISRRISTNRAPYFWKIGSKKRVKHEGFDTMSSSFTLGTAETNEGINVFVTSPSKQELIERKEYIDSFGAKHIRTTYKKMGGYMFGVMWDSIYIDGKSVWANRFHNTQTKGLSDVKLVGAPYSHFVYKTRGGDNIIMSLYEVPPYGEYNPNYFYSSVSWNAPLFFQPYDLTRRIYKLRIKKDRRINGVVKQLAVPFDDYPTFTYIFPTPDSIASKVIFYTDSTKLKQIEAFGIEACAQYPARQNIQSARIFLLTMVITMLITWIFNISIRLLKNRKIRKRYASLIDTCSGGSLADCFDCPLKAQCKRTASLPR